MPTKKDLAGLKAELESHLDQPLSDDTLRWCHHHIFWAKPRYEDMLAHTEEGEWCEKLMIEVTKQMAETMAYYIRFRMYYKLNNGQELHAYMNQVRANIDRKVDVLRKKQGVE